MDTAKILNYKASPELLKDKVIAVTGAGDGLGRAAAVSYAAAGATVVLIGRTPHKLEETAKLIEEAGPAAPPCVAKLDLLSLASEDYHHVSNTIADNYGRLDGLLHNAGLLGVMAPIASSDVQTWYNVMQVNVNASFLLTKELLPLMEQATSGSIIFTSSGVGRGGVAYWGAYSVSKCATESLSQILAQELENTSNIRVNTIDPGIVNTAMRRAAAPGEDPKTNPEPHEIMGAYLYLMSPDSEGVTGQRLDAQ